LSAAGRPPLAARAAPDTAMGIPQYWVVDPKARTVTVLVLDGKDYRQDAVVKAGEPWRTDDPFPLELDPAAFC
jgi:Uma2 family endonuclease